MTESESRRALALALDEIAKGVSAEAIDAEMGAMCRQSFFQLLRQGEGDRQGTHVTQAGVDEASRRFADLTARLMPPELVRRFGG